MGGLCPAFFLVLLRPARWHHDRSMDRRERIRGSTARVRSQAARARVARSLCVRIAARAGARIVDGKLSVGSRARPSI